MLIQALALPLLLAGLAPSDDPVHPTLEEIFRPPRLLGVAPESVQLSADGAWITYTWTDLDAERPERHLWLARSADGDTRRLFDAEVKARVWWLPASPRLLVFRGGWLEVLDPESPDTSRPLMEASGNVSRLTFVEDGSDAFLFQAGEQGDLWWVDPETGLRRAIGADLERRGRWFEVLEGGEEVALFAAPPVEDSGKDGEAKPPREGTTDPERSDARSGAKDEPPRVLYLVPLKGGEPRVVKLEEGAGVRLSGNGRWALQTDRDSDVRHELILADYLTDKVTSVPVRNSLAGDPADRVTLKVTDLQSGESHAPALDAQDRFHMLGVSWSPTGDQFLVQRISEDHHVRQILVVDAASRQVWPVFSERDDAWIGGPTLYAAWSPDGTEIRFTSERTGHNHLYRVPAEGGEVVALTTGDWEVQRVQEVQDGARLLLTTNETDPAEQHLSLLDPRSGERRRCTTRAGCASRPAVSADGSHVAYLQEELGVPRELCVLSLESPAAAPLVLTDTVPEAFHAQSYVPPEIVEYANPEDGVTVRALLYRPQPFDASQSYPAVVFIHGAGYLQNVTRSMTSYDVNYLFHQRLARKGYVVLDADYRHSAGYGRDFRTGVHGFMGGKDLDDVVAGVDYLDGLGFVDRTRVGVYGGSYGGFLTLMALFTRPDVFACGAALRSVTDWRTYNAWYTNPRLGDPEKDAENYRRSSPIEHAEGLQRPLLLLHGLKDSNVFAQDTVRLIEKLIQLGKDFDAMLYPSQNHGFTDPASWIDEYRRIEGFLDRHLQSAPAGRPARAF